MDIGNLPDGGVVLDADQFVVSRGGTARRIQGVRLVRADINGNALLSGDPIMAAGKKLRVGNTAALGGDGGDTTFLYTGDDALIVRNAADNATLFRLSSGGAGALTGTLNVTGALTQAGNQVWHGGNFVPSSYAPVNSPTFTGAVTAPSIVTNSALVSGGANAAYITYGNSVGNYSTGIAPGLDAWRVRENQFAADALVVTRAGTAVPGSLNAGTTIAAGTQITVGGFPVWHQGNFAPANYAPLSGASFTNDVSVGGTLRASTNVLIGGSQFPVWHSGNLNPGLYAPLTGAVFSGNVSAANFSSAGTVASVNFNASGAVAAASMTIGGFSVWHAGNLNPAVYAPLASPALSGAPTAPTAGAGTNNTQIATTAFVQAAVTGGGSGYALLSGANFTGALQQGGNNVYHSGNLNPALYAPLAGATFTGAIRRDANHYLDMAGAVPIHVFDTNDYIQYDRTTNKFGFVIGGTLVASIDSGGTLRVAGNVIGATAP